MPSDDSLGLAAVARGLITPSQLMEAQTERVRTGHAPVTLEKVLIDKGWLTPGQIADLTGKCPICGDAVSRSQRGDTVVRHRCLASQNTPGTAVTADMATLAATPPAPASTHGSRSSPLQDSYADTPRAAPAGIFANRYEILLEVGAGGMGRVYKARDRKLDRVVALKKFMGDGQSPDAIERFTREARTAAKLAHPNIVQVHDIDVHQGAWYLTMDFIMGRSLLQCIEKKAYDRRRLTEIVHQSAEAIHYAHTHQVVHRDIKPSNILIDPDGRPHVADFGLAKEVTPGSGTNPITVSGALIGTPHYMSPEQAAGRVETVNEKSDVYSLGATLYHALTGKTPIRSQALVDVLNEVINIDPTAPSIVDPSIPKDLDTITMKAMSKDPARRYETAKDFADDLGRFLRGEAILARDPSLSERVVRRLKKNKLLSAIVAVAAVALALAGAYGLNQYTLRKDAEAKRNAENERRAQALPIVQKCVDRLTEIEKEIALVEGSNAATRTKIEGVLKDTDQALELDPESASARLVRGRALAILGRFDDALAEFGRAIDANPQFVQARFARAHLYLELHFMPISIPKLKYMDYARMSSAFPRATDSEYTEKAKADFEALKLLPNVDPEKILFLEGFERFVSGDFETARTKMLAYTKMSPADAHGHFVAGMAAFFSEQWKPAVESLDKAVALTPGYIPARLCRALAHQIQGNYGKAINDLQAIRKMDLDAIGPNYPMKREKLVALTFLAEGLARYVTSTFSPLIDQSQRKAGWESILKLVDEAVRLDPENYLAFYLRTRTLGQLDRIDESLESAEAGLKIHDGFANLHVARGLALYRRALKNKRDAADLAAAEAAFGRALVCYPESASAYSYRSAVRVTLGQHDQACADALDSIRVAATSFDVDNAENSLRISVNNVSDPAGVLKLVLELRPAFEKCRRLWLMYGVESVLRGRLGDPEGCFKAAVLAGSQGSKDDAIPQLIESATRNYAVKNEKDALDTANSAEPLVAKCVLVGLSRHRQDRRDFAGGEALAARAIALDEKYADAWLWRAHARYRQSKWAESLEDYEKTVALKPAWKAQFKARMDEVRKHLEQ